MVEGGRFQIDLLAEPCATDDDRSVQQMVGEPGRRQDGLDELGAERAVLGPALAARHVPSASERPCRSEVALVSRAELFPHPYLLSAPFGRTSGQAFGHGSLCSGG